MTEAGSLRVSPYGDTRVQFEPLRKTMATGGGIVGRPRVCQAQGNRTVRAGQSRGV